MSGTKEGGIAAAKANKRKHGKDFYARIGAMGGKKGKTGGFAADVKCRCALIELPHYKRNCAGKLGGLISRRKKKDGA